MNTRVGKPARNGDGRPATRALFETCLTEEMERVKGEIGAAAFAKGSFPEAIDLFRKMSTADTLSAFRTLSGCRLIV
jgi:malate synthase